MKPTLSVLAAVVAVLGVTWLFQGNDFVLYRTFAPKYEQARRQTFEQSKAYTQGMIQELQNMQFEYLRSDTAHQAALGAIILHRAADYDATQLPPDLRAFVDSLKHTR